MPLFSRLEKLFVECGVMGLHDGYHLIPFGELAGSLKSLPGLEGLALRGHDITARDGSLYILPLQLQSR